MLGACGRTCPVTAADAPLVWLLMVCFAVSVWLPTMRLRVVDHCPAPLTGIPPPIFDAPSNSDTLAPDAPVPLSVMLVPDTTVVGEAVSVGGPSGGLTVTGNEVGRAVVSPASVCDAVSVWYPYASETVADHG